MEKTVDSLQFNAEPAVDLEFFGGESTPIDDFDNAYQAEAIEEIAEADVVVDGEVHEVDEPASSHENLRRDDPSLVLTPPRPVVGSAKDAINAMYAAQQEKSPVVESPATSAKDIINNAAYAQAPGGATSAANLHRQSANRRESVRPSASALLRTARSPKRPVPRPTTASADPLARKATPRATSRPRLTNVRKQEASPVVRTSLKLGPKRPPVIVNSRTTVEAPRSTQRVIDPQLRPRKGQTRLMQDMVRRQPVHPSKSAINAIKAAASVATAPYTDQSLTTQHPMRPAGPRVFQDVIRAPRPHSAPASLPAKTDSATSQPAAQKSKPQKASRLRPLDSLKNRFRPAPKGYSADSPDQARPNRPYRPEDYHNPTHPKESSGKEKPKKSAAVPKPPAPLSDSILAQGNQQTKETIHFYGMTEGPEKPSEDPVWANPVPSSDQSAQSTPDHGLGVIEDYQSQGDSVIDQQITAVKATQSAPDNNRYALGGQSPFFLKSVKVEKRPLSDASPRQVVRRETETPIYAAQKLEQNPKKNVYDKKAPQKKLKKEKKPQSTKIYSRPTVIIPSRRRSHGPIVILLVFTIILGAIVGGAIYLFFFQ